VTSAIEHHAVLNVMKHLEKKGHRVSYLPVDESGQVDLSELERAIGPDTLLVSILRANNETGVIQPVDELAACARERGALFHTDAVQACGKIPVNVDELNVDLLSLSAHKLYGPKGVGALYVRSGTPFRPLLRGGGQERSRRPGTENVAGTEGLGAAARLALDSLASVAPRLQALRDELERTVLRAVPGAHVNGGGAQRVPNTVNFRFAGADGEQIVHSLDRSGYAVSTGAACSSGAVSPSHVLVAMGLAPEEVQGSIRVSLGRSTTAEDVSGFARALEDAVRASRTKKRSETDVDIGVVS
jgi:cysteine desulfurase